MNNNEGRPEGSGAKANANAPGHPGMLVAFALAYAALAYFALSLPLSSRFPPFVWPADGLALGALLVASRRRWPALLAIVAAINLAAGLAFKTNVAETFAAVVMGVGEPALLAAVLLRLGGGRVGISTLLGLGGFLVNLVPMVAIVAFTDALATYAFSDAPLREQWSITFVSDFLGVIVVAPLLLAWGQGGRRASRRTLRDRALKDRTAELVALFAGLVFTTHFVFRATSADSGYVPALAYLCVPFLIWAALRFGLRAATAGLVVFGLLCFWHTAQGTGPFAVAGLPQWRSLLHVQGYIAAVIVSTLFAAALLAEREAEARSTEAWRLRHQAAIRASGSLLYELDPVTGFLLWDGDTRAVLGIAAEELAHVRQWMAIVHPDDRARLRGIREKFVRGELAEMIAEYRVRRGGQDWITVAVNGYAMDDGSAGRGGRRRVIGFVRDVSARVKAEAEREALAVQLRQAEKMEAVGRLAGGIAHDFNNILGAILGYGELAQARAAQDPQLKRYLDTIVNAGNRAKSLVSQILAYSRAEPGVKTPVAVTPIAAEVCELIRGSTSAIDVHFRGPEGEATVMGDPTRLHQLLMNLASNAVQAMGEGGTLDIALEARTLAAPVKTRLAEVAPGDWVVIRVADTGEGIPPEVIDRIFEPFFTTKAAGRGTGLGLALVHSIVRESGGAIDVESERGRGTTFTVWLPRIEGGEPKAVGVAELAGGQGQVILAVDDEPEVLAALEEMLATLGYEPAGYTDSRAALEAFLADPARYEAVVSDEVMPGLTGTQLLVELRKARPGIPFVIASGYGGAGFETRALAAGVNLVLKKPYRMQEIGDVLRGFFAKS